MSTQETVKNGKPSGRKIELDFLRGIAILLVLFYHYNFPETGIGFVDWIGDTGRLVGRVGVDMFFTLSGFLVGGLLLKEYQLTGKLDGRRFLLRRAFKIWPALYVLLLFHVIIGRHPIGSFLWQNIFHVQNYFGTSIAQTWSLAVEEHFYLLLTVLISVMVGRKPLTIIKVLSVICLVVLGLRIYIVSTGDLDAAFRQTQYRIDSLLYGVILAAIFYFYPEKFAALAKKKWTLIFGSIFLVLWIYFTSANYALVRTIGYSINGIGFCILFVCVITYSGSISKNWIYKGVAWVGLYSYGIYLWHTLALAPGAKAISYLSAAHVHPMIIWVVSTTVQFVVGIVIGYVMTKIVEWPFLKIREKFYPTVEKLEMRPEPARS